MDVKRLSTNTCSDYSDDEISFGPRSRTVTPSLSQPSTPLKPLLEEEHIDVHSPKAIPNTGMILDIKKLNLTPKSEIRRSLEDPDTVSPSCQRSISFQEVGESTEKELLAHQTETFAQDFDNMFDEKVQAVKTSHNISITDLCDSITKMDLDCSLEKRASMEKNTSPYVPGEVRTEIHNLGNLLVAEANKSSTTVFISQEEEEELLGDSPGGQEEDPFDGTISQFDKLLDQDLEVLRSKSPKPVQGDLDLSEIAKYFESKYNSFSDKTSTTVEAAEYQADSPGNVMPNDLANTQLDSFVTVETVATTLDTVESGVYEGVGESSFLYKSFDIPNNEDSFIVLPNPDIGEERLSAGSFQRVALQAASEAASSQLYSQAMTPKQVSPEPSSDASVIVIPEPSSGIVYDEVSDTDLSAYDVGNKFTEKTDITGQCDYDNVSETDLGEYLSQHKNLDCAHDTKSEERVDEVLQTEESFVQKPLDSSSGSVAHCTEEEASRVSSLCELENESQLNMSEKCKDNLEVNESSSEIQSEGELQIVVDENYGEDSFNKKTCPLSDESVTENTATSSEGCDSFIETSVNVAVECINTTQEFSDPNDGSIKEEGDNDMDTSDPVNVTAEAEHLNVSHNSVHLSVEPDQHVEDCVTDQENIFSNSGKMPPSAQEPIGLATESPCAHNEFTSVGVEHTEADIVDTAVSTRVEVESTVKFVAEPDIVEDEVALGQAETTSQKAELTLVEAIADAKPTNDEVEPTIHQTESVEAAPVIEERHTITEDDPAIFDTEPVSAEAVSAIVEVGPLTVEEEHAIVGADEEIVAGVADIADNEPATTATDEPVGIEPEPANMAAEAAIVDSRATITDDEPVITEAEPVVAHPAPESNVDEAAVAEAGSIMIEAEPGIDEDIPVVAEEEPLIVKEEPDIADEEIVTAEAAISEDDSTIATAKPVIVEDEATIAEDDPDIASAELSTVEGEPVSAKDKPTLGKTEFALVEGEPVTTEHEPTFAETESAIVEVEPLITKDKYTICETESAMEAAPSESEPTVAEAEPVIPTATPVIVEEELVISQAESINIVDKENVAEAEQLSDETEPAIAEDKPITDQPEATSAENHPSKIAVEAEKITQEIEPANVDFELEPAVRDELKPDFNGVESTAEPSDLEGSSSTKDNHCESTEEPITTRQEEDRLSSDENVVASASTPENSETNSRGISEKISTDIALPADSSELSENPPTAHLESITNLSRVEEQDEPTEVEEVANGRASEEEFVIARPDFLEEEEDRIGPLCSRDSISSVKSRESLGLLPPSYLANIDNDDLFVSQVNSPSVLFGEKEKSYLKRVLKAPTPIYQGKQIVMEASKGGRGKATTPLSCKPKPFRVDQKSTPLKAIHSPLPNTTPTRSSSSSKRPPTPTRTTAKAPRPSTLPCMAPQRPQDLPPEKSTFAAFRAKIGSPAPKTPASPVPKSASVGDIKQPWMPPSPRPHLRAPVSPRSRPLSPFGTPKKSQSCEGSGRIMTPQRDQPPTPTRPGSVQTKPRSTFKPPPVISTPPRKKQTCATPPRSRAEYSRSASAGTLLVENDENTAPSAAQRKPPTPRAKSGAVTTATPRNKPAVTKPATPKVSKPVKVTKPATPKVEAAPSKAPAAKRRLSKSSKPTSDSTELAKKRPATKPKIGGVAAHKTMSSVPPKVGGSVASKVGSTATSKINTGLAGRADLKKVAEKSKLGGSRAVPSATPGTKRPVLGSLENKTKQDETSNKPKRTSSVGRPAASEASKGAAPGAKSGVAAKSGLPTRSRIPAPRSRLPSKLPTRSAK